jgi:excisionase family DNA binding protein
MDRLLTTDEVARILGYHRKAVNTAILQGNLKATRYGWAWLTKASDLKTFIETHPRPNKLAHINLDTPDWMARAIEASQKPGWFNDTLNKAVKEGSK